MPHKQQKLSAALEKRLRRKVRLQCAIDPQLLGGAMHPRRRPGDRRLARTRLERIAYDLTA